MKPGDHVILSLFTSLPADDPLQLTPMLTSAANQLAFRICNTSEQDFLGGMHRIYAFVAIRP